MALPIYRIVINESDDTGLSAVSLVDLPAVEKDFILFDKESFLFSSDDEKQIISGIALLADTPIYRRSDTRGEYYVVFQADTVRLLVEKYSKNGLFNSVNLMHQADTFVNSVHMIESILIDKERGICPTEFKDVPDGSWYVSYHVEDPVLWEEIKKGEWFRGFSVEVLSDLELIENKSNNRMNKLFKLAKAVLKLAEIPTDKETLIIEGEIEVGKPVFVETEEGPIEAADGEYTLEDGTVIVIEAGLIIEIRPVEVVEEPAQVEEIEAVEEPEAPEVEEPQEDEKDIRIKELEAENEELKARIAELEAQLAEAEEKLKMSVETPITKLEKTKKTTISKDNKALKYFK